MEHKYTLHIDAFTPNTLPMKRFAEYVADLAQMLGHNENVHFERIEKGSLRTIARVDGAAFAKVDARVKLINTPDAAPDALKAYQRLNKLLQEDNTAGKLLNEEGAVILEFRGREAPSEPVFPAFYEHTFIDGILTSLSGSDETKHAQVIDGDQKLTGLETKDHELLHRLKDHLWGDPIRLFGRARFFRDERGSWQMTRFVIDDFEVLKTSSFSDTIDELRSIKDGIEVNSQLLRELQEERSEGLDEK